MLAVLVAACLSILGVGTVALLKRSGIRSLTLTFRDSQSSQLWSHITETMPNMIVTPGVDAAFRLRTLSEVGQYHRLKGPRVLVCIGAPDDEISQTHVNVWGVMTESGPLMYAVSGCPRTALVIACISSWMKARAVYVSLTDADFVVPVLRQFARFLMGLPTQTRYELEWLLRRTRRHQMSAKAYFWRARRTVHGLLTESSMRIPP